MIELTKYNQWVVAGSDKIPLIENNGQLFRHSVTAGYYMSYKQACAVANKYGLYVGFVLTDNDPFTCIDLDVKEGVTTREQLNKFSKIVTAFDSYTELSASGNGVHIWVKGDIGKGKRTAGIELYSRERFIIMTHQPITKINYLTCKNRILPLYQRAKVYEPINERQYFLDLLASECNSTKTAQISLTERESTLSDREVWERAKNAKNSAKFVLLCEGRWQELGYPSQSEADLALMAIFAFYSESNEQCRRMFRQTYLGVRSKATRDDVYLNRCLKAVRARIEFERLEREEEEKLAIKLAKELADKLRSNIPGYRTDVPRVHLIDKFGNNFTVPYVINDNSRRGYFYDKNGNLISAPEYINNISDTKVNTNDNNDNIVSNTHVNTQPNTTNNSINRVSNINNNSITNTISNTIYNSIDNSIYTLNNTQSYSVTFHHEPAIAPKPESEPVVEPEPIAEPVLNSEPVVEAEPEAEQVTKERFDNTVNNEHNVVATEQAKINKNWGLENENYIENSKNNNTISSDILPANNSNVSLVHIPQNLTEAVMSYYNWPPGIAGEIAKQIFINSPRPVPEISIATALGFLSGVCGKAFNVSNSGLNMYIVLIAKSGTGKEVLHSGINFICNQIKKAGVDNVYKFVSTSKYASGSALIKEFAERQSFVNVIGEFGHKMQEFSDIRKSEAAKTLRTVMTDLYQKSGPYDTVGGVSYSDKTKNVDVNTSVAYSMIGESTPATFYQSLSGDMMEDGFLSRFTVIEYSGERTDKNDIDYMTMSPELLSKLIALTKQALENIHNNISTAVKYDIAARALLDEYSDYCDMNITAAGDNESFRQMFNRAHLKVLRLSALLACVDNPARPTITVEHVEWAKWLVDCNINIIRSKLDNGEIGLDDESRYNLVMKYVKKAINEGYKSWQVGESNFQKVNAMLADNIIPYRYFSQCLSKHASFKTNYAGTARILKDTLKSLTEQGILQPVDKATLRQYGYLGDAFRVISF